MTKTKQQPQSTKGKRVLKSTSGKKVLGIGAIVIAVILTLIGIFYLTAVVVPMVNEQGKMERYLKERYGKEFVVNNVRVTGSGIGVKGSIRGDAHPKDDPSLKFELRKPEDRNFYDYDSFLTELWSRQGREQVDKFVKELGSVRNYSLTIRTSTSYTDTLHAYTPSFSEIQAMNPHAFSYTLSMSSTTPTTDNEPSEAELARAFKIVEFVKSQKSDEPEIYYAFKNVPRSDGKPFYQYIITVKGEKAVASIHQPDDLRQYFDMTYEAKQGAKR